MKAISLFSGCGGCSLGLNYAGYDVRLAVDVDRDACVTYSMNLKPEVVWCTDLTTATPQQLLSRANLKLYELDLLVGGPPCQGFSSAGTRDWHDPRNTLIKKFVEIVSILKPTWFVMENVEGLLTTKEGFYIIEAISKFLESGYWVKVKKVYMEKYGLPQKRKRVFIVGNLENCEFEFPSVTHHESMPLDLFSQQKQLSILDAISDLQSSSNDEFFFYNKQPNSDYQLKLRQLNGKPVTLHKAKSVNALAQKRILLLKQGMTMKNLPEDLQHPSFTKRAFRRVMDGTPTEKRGGAPSGLKRLISSQPSLTITSASSTEFVHPIEDRLLTLRECARIQSFPDWYEFSGSWSSISTQIGNAIPPIFMQVLANHIGNHATWHPVQNSRGRWLGIDATKSDGMSPVLIKMLTELEKKTSIYIKKLMPSLDKETRQLINSARTLGSKGLSVFLEDRQLLRLCAIVASDLGYQTLIQGIANEEELKNGYYGTPMEWFDAPVPPDISLGETFLGLKQRIDDFSTYFKGLCELHKRRLKFKLILEHQAIPQIEQIVPRCLLEFGMRPSETLASWLVWRKWLYDIDNRSAQETGYLFEPILAAAIGGVPFSASTSPVKRAENRNKGRQVDCLDGRLAYEFKMRVTIAASGQGRFKEELDFARDCSESGYTPILLVLDPTPSTRLGELAAEYSKYGGSAYIGNDAWNHIESKAGQVMGRFVENYVKAPLQEIDNTYTNLQPIHLSDTGAEISVQVGTQTFSISRGGVKFDAEQEGEIGLIDE